MPVPEYDVLVIGSGFGGSVTALRLTEKGYRVGVLEAGRRFADDEFATTSWKVRDYLFAPAVGCYGILRITPLRQVAVFGGAGVGGGSLVYANTLYRPPAAFYTDPQWSSITDWAAELDGWYDQASRMLGVTTNPVTTAADDVLRSVAEDLGVGHTYTRTPVGVLFGEPGRPGGSTVPDPFFGGVGPDPDTHIEAVRYGPGSNLLGSLAAVMVDGDRPRARALLGALRRHWRDLPRLHDPRRWSQQSIVLLTMQSLDNSITLDTRRGLFGRRLTSRPGVGEPNPSWIPMANEVARRVAAKIDGFPVASVSDLVGIPMTGHFIGGCAIGADPGTGVVDPYQRVYGHPGLHVVDGSVVPANLGVNPSLTITALAERAMSFWPVQGESDPRPALGEAYRPVSPVPASAPVVPVGAPARAAAAGPVREAGRVTADVAPRRRRLEPDQRRQQILAHAVRLFGERPYPLVSTTDIARSAGVARGLINHYFGTKRDLYLEVVRVMVTIPPVVLDRLPAGTPAQRADASVTWFLDVVARHGRSWLAAMGAGNDPEVDRIRAEADDATADLMLTAFGLGSVQAQRDQLRAMLRSWTGLAKAAAREWLEPGPLTRQDVHLLLTHSLRTLIYETFPAISPQAAVALSSTPAIPAGPAHPATRADRAKQGPA